VGLDAQELESGTKLARFGNGLQSLTSSPPDTRGTIVAGAARMGTAAHGRIAKAVRLASEAGRLRLN
jgi:hypothetical protein